MKNGELFSFDKTIAREVCEVVSYPFEIPELLGEVIMRIGRRLDLASVPLTLNRFAPMLVRYVGQQ